MNILIVEDEARIAKRIQRMVHDILGQDLQSIRHIYTLQEALHAIENNAPDLLLLDLNLNGDNGFDLLTTAVSKSFHTVIISAYKDQAITAFEYGVLDFVPKPFNQERLEQALDRVLSKTSTTKQATKYLAVKKRHKVALIPIEQIVYIKGAGAYSELILIDGQKELHDKSLDKLDQLLTESFQRIHKSYLVKLSEIKGIQVSSGSKYMAELKNGEQIPIGRTRYKELKEKWV
ncbi:MAG: LytTR family DNA-binding domain-containing protein [Cytophagales bacterium]|nr:LytTR family DNA-binding domain-containing protein [Cytophagales bacterium]